MSSVDPITDIFVNAERDILPKRIATHFEVAKFNAENGDISGKNEHITKAAQDFEAVFLGQMLKAMVPEESNKDSLFSSKESDEIFRGMMMEQYAKEITRTGGIGIAEYIERSLAQRALLTAQEV